MLAYSCSRDYTQGYPWQRWHPGVAEPDPGVAAHRRRPRSVGRERERESETETETKTEAVKDREEHPNQHRAQSRSQAAKGLPRHCLLHCLLHCLRTHTHTRSGPRGGTAAAGVLGWHRHMCVTHTWQRGGGGEHVAASAICSCATPSPRSRQDGTNASCPKQKARMPHGIPVRGAGHQGAGQAGGGDRRRTARSAPWTRSERQANEQANEQAVCALFGRRTE